MPILENPRESPCFGCGPEHARGLRLAFEEEALPDGTCGVLSRFTPKADEIGWPGLQHGGLHFLVLHETSYWAALTLGAKVMQFSGTATFHLDRLPRVGVAHIARASISAREGTGFAIHAESRTAEAGKLCGTLDSHWIPSSRAAVERAHIELPQYLLDEMDP